MKYFIQLSFSYLVLFCLSNCCIRHSDCFCDPPEPDLAEHAIDWVSLYYENPVPTLVYEDEMGNVDTLIIEQIEDTEWLGGDECGTNGDRMIALLRSTMTNELLFSTAATRYSNIYFNNLEDYLDYTEHIPVSFFWRPDVMLDEIELIDYNEFSTVAFNTAFNWQGEQITVVEVKCEAQEECMSFKLQNFVVSQEYGLLEYTDINGIHWRKIN